MNNADEFLKQKHLFQLGDLPTESVHPLTVQLSHLAQHDVPQGLRTLQRIDLEALRKIANGFEQCAELFTAVSSTLKAGQRIFLVGCGATGRLSLSLEYLWRKQNPGSDQIVSLMAGGDVALVHSLEGFEDFPHYGARHLLQLGFGPDDLLIATTEGGETPYVIGATEKAAEHSSRRPFFLYCNTREILLNKVERSKRVLTNPGIASLCLATGPMALTGSTRMQASTVLMLVVGLALEYREVSEAKGQLEKWIEYLERVDATKLEPFVNLEAATYREGGVTCYQVEDLAITVFTDTTERAPTFNLAPFENPTQPPPAPGRHSLTYISLPQTMDSKSAWRALLARDPRPLLWPEIHPKTSAEYLLSFDFSRHATDFRARLLPQITQSIFTILKRDANLCFQFRGLNEHFEWPRQIALFDHLGLKMLLNMHSTLVMGQLGRFEGNLMTWLYPSNGKLVDRAARYTQILLRQKGVLDFDYDSIVRAQFAVKPTLSPKESIVHRTIDWLEQEA